ncbi:MAG TPA: MFS transporter [Opitutaceae bacterium]|nr:MFS transporter [Opitutaceae bacterium]
MFRWYHQSTAPERRTFLACFSAWGVDALDAQMFSLLIPAVMATFALTRAEAGLIGSAGLVASAIGGWLAGTLSDRYGRLRVLQATILWFSAFTFLSAFAQSYAQLLVVRTLQGFGFGGEWTAGAVLLAEAVRPELRGRAMGTVQSAWAVGWGGAVALYALVFSWVPPALGWRLMFGLGVLPALLVVAIQRALPRDPPRRSAAARPSFGRILLAIFSGRTWRTTTLACLLGVGAHGGYYALMTWLPSYLKSERHLSVMATGGNLAIVIFAFGCGCLASAELLDRIGRRRNIVLFAVACIVAVAIYLYVPLSDAQMLWAGFPLGFCAAGIPASLGPFLNELFADGSRGTGVGFSYNFGRIASAVFPWLVGHASASMPLGHAIAVDAVLAYGIVIVAVLLLPETGGGLVRGELAAPPSPCPSTPPPVAHEPCSHPA